MNKTCPLQLRTAIVLASIASFTLHYGDALSTDTSRSSFAKPSRAASSCILFASKIDRYSTANSGRGYCTRCQRPPIVCICHALQESPIECGVRILILQHPREARKRKRTSTVPLIGLSIKDVDVCVGSTFSEGSNPRLDEALSECDSLLLYPGDRAVPLGAYLDTKEQNISGSQTIETVNSGGQRTLVVIDGTWAQTQTMIQKSPCLKRFSQVMFDDDAVSLFDPIRQEPASHCTSTLEAISRALRLLGGGDAASKAADALEDSLTAMVAGQLRFALDDSTSRPRFKRNDDVEPEDDSGESHRQRQRKITRRRTAQLSLPRKKTPEEIEADRIRFIYVGHLG